MIHGRQSREVYIDGELLSPARSQAIRNHSPNGFAWGYGGSGPSQLALAILLEFADEEFAKEHYQQFKFDVIEPIEDMREFQLNEQDVIAWINKQIENEAT
jgi:hypothetical protein